MTTISFFDLNPVYGNKTLYLGVPRRYYSDLEKHFNIVIDGVKRWHQVSRSDSKWVNGEWIETWKHDSKSLNDNIVFVRSHNKIDIHATQSYAEMHKRDFGSKRSYFLYCKDDDADAQYLMFVFQDLKDEAWFKLIDEDTGYTITQHPMVIPCSLHGCWLQTNWSLDLERIDDLD